MSARKETRKPNSSPATHRASSLLELIHSDLAGPMATTSLGGAKYCLLYIGDYSRYTTIYTIKNKSAVIECFQIFKVEMENHYKHRIKRFRSNQCWEYTSAAFSRLLTEAVHTAVYLQNQSPTSALEKSMTQLEAITGETPKLGALISFGA